MTSIAQRSVPRALDDEVPGSIPSRTKLGNEVFYIDFGPGVLGECHYSGVHSIRTSLDYSYLAYCRSWLGQELEHNILFILDAGKS